MGAGRPPWRIHYRRQDGMLEGAESYWDGYCVVSNGEALGKSPALHHNLIVKILLVLEFEYHN